MASLLPRSRDILVPSNASGDRGIAWTATGQKCPDSLGNGWSGWNCTSIFRVMSPTLLLLSYRPGGME